MSQTTLTPISFSEADRFSQPATSTQGASLKLIVFSFSSPQGESLYFGVRIESMYRILPQTEVHSSGVPLTGVAHLLDQEVTILDLHQYIFQTSVQQSRYILVVKTATSELLGIPVIESPALAEVAIANVRILPPSYRQMDALGIASHVAVVEMEEGTQTVFLCDVEQFVILLSQRSV
jgi:chemotaxis signal transduction protein